MKIATLLLSLALASATPALAVQYDRILPAQSRLAYVSKQMGVPVEGGFRRFTAQFAFDPARPEAAQAALEVDLASIDAGSREVNEEVLGRNWFDVRRFPSARFVSTGLRHLGGGRYEVRGQLTLKGRTRELAAPFTYRPEGEHAVLEGGFVLKRLDFGIGEGPWGDTDTVADEVQVKFRFLAAQSAAKPAAGVKSGGKPR